jgi:hypothetical protein
MYALSGRMYRTLFSRNSRGLTSRTIRLPCCSGTRISGLTSETIHCR